MHEDQGVDTTASAIMLDGHVYPLRQFVKDQCFTWTKSVHGKDGMDFWLKVLEANDDGENTITAVKAHFESWGYVVVTLAGDCAEWEDSE